LTTKMLASTVQFSNNHPKHNHPTEHHDQTIRLTASDLRYDSQMIRGQDNTLAPHKREAACVLSGPNSVSNTP
jgi:hypothetical protein